MMGRTHALTGWCAGLALAPAVGAGSVHQAVAFAATAGWLGIAVAAGCLTHCLGDALTEAGCPFLFPVPIAGETWYEIRPPRFLRFKTGKKVENRLIFPVFVLLGVLLVPGVWNYV